MATGLTEQIENYLTYKFAGKRAKRMSNKYVKTIKHRRERRRAKTNPVCDPEYKRYHGWEW